jgi:hypothetical protein
VVLPAAPTRAPEPDSTLRSRLPPPAAPIRRISGMTVALLAVVGLFVLGAIQFQLWEHLRGFAGAGSAGQIAPGETAATTGVPSPAAPIAVARSPRAEAPGAVEPASVPTPIPTSLPAGSPTPHAGFEAGPAPIVAAPAAAVAPAVAAAPAAPEPEATPEPAQRTVSIDLVSQPAGATVWLDKEVQPRGRTPLSLVLPAGKQTHALILRLRGHQARVLPLSASENRTVDVTLARAAPLRLRARPRTRRVDTRAPTRDEAEAPEDTAQEWSEKLTD